MARTRAIVKRRRAVRNVHKITRTMGLIATSKFRRAHERAVRARPYCEKVAALADLVAETIRAAGESFSHPLLERREPPAGDLLLVLTSDRGLCGGYNAAVVRSAVAHLRDCQSAGRATRLEIVGRKGRGYLRFMGLAADQAHEGFGESSTFEQIEGLADRFIDLFARQRTVDTIHVAYTRFISAGLQAPTVIRLLPLGEAAADPNKAAGDNKPAEGAAPPGGYEFSPSPRELLAELLPRTVKVRLLQFFNEAAVSEHVARMRAMNAATDNADEMIRSLTRAYNRARQSQITGELAEIIGGAAALE